MIIAARTWTLIGIAAGGGVGVFLAIAIAELYVNAPQERVEQFGLSSLLDGPSNRPDNVMTPLEEARQRFKAGHRTDRDSRTSPEISSTKLMMRAISKLNERQRHLKIGDADRLLRKHAESIVEVFGLTDKYLANNPRLAPLGADVETAVVARLKGKGPERFGFLDD